MKKLKSILAAGLFASSAFAFPSVQGTYFGTCQAQYAGTQAAPCQMQLYVDNYNQVTIPGNANCISPVAFTGVFYDERETVELRSGGWNAQPAGQTLSLSFGRRGGRYRASGSGYGIRDRKWTYRCSFQQQ